jgi:hypothetical protein
MTVVSELLSKEYPMVTTLVDEHVDAVAFKVNGDVTSVLFTGLLTVTPARAGKVMVRASTEMRVDLRAKFIDCPLRMQAYFCDDASMLVQLERRKVLGY